MTEPKTKGAWIDFATNGEYSEQSYAPDLYQPTGIIEPIAGLESINDSMVEQFDQLGFISVADAFDATVVGQAVADLERLITDPPEGFGGIMYEAGAAGRAESFTADERMQHVRKLARFVDHAPRLRWLMDDPRMVSVLRRLLGDREAHMFQDMALLKPPHGREKPWHQDNAYFTLKLGEPVVGVWIALDEATVANGCMHVIPGSHRNGPVVHFKRRDWQICDDQVARDRVVAAPLKPGGVLFFSGMMHHGTPTNHTDRGRRAVQYHFCAADAEWADEQAKQAAFGADGKDVEC